MIKFFIEKWNKNNHLLEKYIKDNPDAMMDLSYKGLVSLVVESIINANSEREILNSNMNSITEVDNGDYQGTLLYLIPFETYQPSYDEYIITFCSYGSCSACDTLEGVKSDYSDSKNIDTFTKDFMTMSLHIIQNMQLPYGSIDEHIRFKRWEI